MLLAVSLCLNSSTSLGGVDWRRGHRLEGDAVVESEQEVLAGGRGRVDAHAVEAVALDVNELGRQRDNSLLRDERDPEQVALRRDGVARQVLERQRQTTEVRYLGRAQHLVVRQIIHLRDQYLRPHKAREGRPLSRVKPP